MKPKVTPKPPLVTPSMTQNDALPSPFEGPLLLISLFALYMIYSCTTWYLTFASIFLYNILRRFLFSSIYGLEELTPMDYFFLYDNYKNRANIMCVTIWHKFDLERVRQQVIERALRFPRMKQRLVRKFSAYLW